MQRTDVLVPHVSNLLSNLLGRLVREIADMGNHMDKVSSSC